ncbi:MAG: SAM-dependent methyltransferase [Campylobacterales bacterium]|nr:SAM-dependent methyltransferase [Campylobacterales bacterium]
MHDWLYGERGYYTQYKEIGKAGDFYTSVSASKFFGGTIAKHIISVIDEGFLPKETTICEIGAHKGYLLADIVQFIYTLRPELLQSLSFAIVERFDFLQEEQKRYFEQSFGDAVRLKQVKSLSELQLKSAFFVANEIFDAFSCELFYKGKIGTLKEGKIVFEQEDAWVSEQAEKYHKDRGEIARGYEAFAREMSAAAQIFEFMTFDYGEMQARPDFSIRVYKEHEVFALFDETINLNELFGTSDITYDVTFEHLKDAYTEVGVEMFSYKTQALAMVDMGLLELLEILKEHGGEELYLHELERAKQLILPSFLGERFKMMSFRKHFKKEKI